jgi:hypothetical protein
MPLETVLTLRIVLVATGKKSGTATTKPLEILW